MSETPNGAIRRLIAEHRLGRGMNQTQLAREVSALGCPMRQTTVSKIEDGTRKVGVDELLTIAVALDVPPIVLMIPFDTEEDYAIALDHEHPPWFIYEWFVGTHGLTGKPEVWTALDYYASVRGAQIQLRRLERLQEADGPAYDAVLQQLADAIYDMQAAGWPCQGLAGDYRQISEKRGIRPRSPRKRIEDEIGGPVSGPLQQEED